MDPFKSYEAALPGIIAEQPSSIMRQREVRPDTFSGPTVYTAGSYTVRIEPMKQLGTETFDEKGTVAKMWFTLVGHSLPRNVEEGGKIVPLFRPDDTITDQDGNTFVVRSPQYCRGKTVQVTLELRG